MKITTYQNWHSKNSLNGPIDFFKNLFHNVKILSIKKSVDPYGFTGEFCQRVIKYLRKEEVIPHLHKLRK